MVQVKFQTFLALVLLSIFCLRQAVSTTQHANRSHPIKLSELEAYIEEMDKTDGWTAEFESLPPPQRQLKAWTYAAQKENVGKHRYPPPDDNLLTYDETRVILTRNPNEHYSDFINANWVDGVLETRRYIGTQCPMASTIADFYRMVWQYNIHQVVMLANPHDIEKKKCEKYFPDGTATYGEIEIVLQRHYDLGDVIVRIYALKKGAITRVFVHNHFVSWPDMGVPSDPKKLLNLIRQYRSSDTYTRAWPLLVHCSAGVGRTGTFLLTDAIFEQALTHDTLDFLKHLWHIRNQRISLVEKSEQYALAHRVVLQAYKEGLFDPSKNPWQVNPNLLSHGSSMTFGSLSLLLTAMVTLISY